MDATAEIAAMLERLATIQVDSDPWPHVYATDFLPETLYRDLISALPSAPRAPGTTPRIWARTPLQTPITPGKGTYTAAEGRMLTNLPTPDWWRSDVADVLSTLTVMLSHPAVVRSLFDVFAKSQPTEVARSHEDGIEVSSIIRLMHDAEDYDLLVHTDQPEKFLSIVVYLPTGGGTEGGTSLYKNPRKTLEISGYNYYGTGFFEPAKKLPFAPNSAFIFIRTEESFHAKPKTEADVRVDRFTLQANYALMRRVGEKYVPVLPKNHAKPQPHRQML